MIYKKYHKHTIQKQAKKSFNAIHNMNNYLATCCPEGAEIMVSNKNFASFLYINIYDFVISSREQLMELSYHENSNIKYQTCIARTSNSSGTCHARSFSKFDRGSNPDSKRQKYLRNFSTMSATISASSRGIKIQKNNRQKWL